MAVDEGCPSLSGQPLGQTEVSHVRLAGSIEQDIGRLQIAMQDAALVGIMHRAGDGREQLGRGLRIIGESRRPVRPGCPPRSARMVK